MVGKQDCAQTDPSAKYIVGKQSRRGRLTHYHCMKRFININLLLSSNTCQLGFALSSKIHFQNCAMLTKLYSYEFDNFMCIAICMVNVSQNSTYYEQLWIWTMNTVFSCSSLGKLCIEVTPADKIAFISEELCIGCGICSKVMI